MRARAYAFAIQPKTQPASMHFELLNRLGNAVFVDGIDGIAVHGTCSVGDSYAAVLQSLASLSASLGHRSRSLPFLEI